MVNFNLLIKQIFGEIFQDFKKKIKLLRLNQNVKVKKSFKIRHLRKIKK